MNFALTEFSEVRIRFQKMASCASCLWWKGMTRLGSGSGGRRPRVLGKKVSAHHVLRLGLRALVVDLDPVCSRPPPPTHRGLRAFPRSDRRAGDHPRQERRGGITASDGALASRAEMVRGGPPAPCCDQSWRSSVQCPVGRPGSLLGRTKWLDGPFLDVLHPTPHPRLRWHLGGAGLERLRPAAPASRPIGTVCQPNPLDWYSRMAPAADAGGGDPLV